MSSEGSPDPFETRRGRRSVEMRGYVVRADQQIIDVTVAELSYSGCAVRTEIPLEPGEAVLISVLGRGGGKAIVRWYQDRRAGLEFEPSDVRHERRARAGDRKLIDATVLLRRSAHSGYLVKVFDVSPSGCRCEFIERPNIGERVWIKFDRLEALESEVRWLKDTNAGVRFMNPIHPAVFDLLLQRIS